MGKKAVGETASNVFYQARMQASDQEQFSSREKASALLGIDRTRLARIENDTVLPHPDEIAIMAEKYNAPFLTNFYCAECCPLGHGRVVKAEDKALDRVALQVLGSLQNAESVAKTLVEIAADGKIESSEKAKLREVLDLLGKITASAEALRLWAEKYVD